LFYTLAESIRILETHPSWVYYQFKVHSSILGFLRKEGRNRVITSVQLSVLQKIRDWNNLPKIDQFKRYLRMKNLERIANLSVLISRERDPDKKKKLDQELLKLQDINCGNDLRLRSLEFKEE